MGVWPIWPTGRPLLISAFDFPVPKNEFVNLMRRTNDLPIADPDALYDDASARAAMLAAGHEFRPDRAASPKRSTRSGATRSTTPNCA